MPTVPTPPAPPAQGADATPEFAQFYLDTRRRLVLETYALTGDLSAARSAVRDAFEAASHHWRKVSRLPDPEEWVRPRAWGMAQRRHVARLWHREKGLDERQRMVLDALHHLPDQQRKVLLLTHLARLAPSGIGRELGETTARVEHQLAAATRSFGQEAGVADGEVLAAIESLSPLAEATALPPAPMVEQAGRRRQWRYGLVGVAVLLALTLLSGGFVTGSGTEDPAAAQPSAGDAEPVARPVNAGMLLTLAQVRRLAPDAPWEVVETSDNTTGTGINTVCQDTRFADPSGEGTFIRKFVAAGEPRRSYLETIEISRTVRAAAAAYRTTLGWFAGCSEARLQLLNAYRVRGLGPQAQVLRLRIPGEVRRTYDVGLARTGAVTVSTVLETRDGRPVPVARAVGVLTSAVRNVCEADPAGPCPGEVSTAPVLPPPSGETRGTLAAADLPVVGSIDSPWVGTDPARARPNLAATTCDKTDFVKAGAPRAMTRTFLVPEARVPSRFGITETYGRFTSERRARTLVRDVVRAMRTCEERDLGAQVSSEVVQTEGYRGSEYALWRLDSEIDEEATQGFWMGVARVGRYVAQVNFTPAGRNDIDEVTFQALVTRARDRLFELPGAAR